MSYLCQCIWYLAITNLVRVNIPVILGKSDFRIYEITRGRELEFIVMQKAITFLQENILKDVPAPTIDEQDCQTLIGKSDACKSVEAKS